MDSAPDDRTLLKATNLSVSASSPGGDSVLIHDVSFSVYGREVLIFLGESGSGKTILSRSLTKLFPATSAPRIDGSVTFEGQQLLTLSESELTLIRRRRIRYVFQEPMQSLNPLARIGHQMRLAADGSSDNDRDLHTTLRLVGLDNSEELLDLYPHELSVGMAQRVCIAMAILPSPALLIADEPTSAVDASLQRRILDLLISIQRSSTMSLVLITHDLDVARCYGDRIIVMYGGKIIETAPWKAFFENPLHPYSRLLLDAHRASQRRAGLTNTTPGPVIVDIPHQGCAFQPRCPIAEKKCKESTPELEPLPGEREVRCFCLR
ncbi:MAG TPA: ABC transporter ATP-binding protein [Bacteroidota bacterium]